MENTLQYVDKVCTVYDLKGSTPVSGVYTGLTEIVDKFFVPWRKQIVGDLVIEVTELIGEGERVVALGQGAAKTVFDLNYDNDYAFVFTVKTRQYDDPQGAAERILSDDYDDKPKS